MQLNFGAQRYGSGPFREDDLHVPRWRWVCCLLKKKGLPPAVPLGIRVNHVYFTKVSCFRDVFESTFTLPETNIAPENGWLEY